MTKGDKKICLNKAESELYVICDVQNSGDRKEPAGINRIGNEGSYKGKPSFLFGRAETEKPVKKPTGGAILN